MINNLEIEGFAPSKSVFGVYIKKTEIETIVFVSSNQNNPELLKKIFSSIAYEIGDVKSFKTLHYSDYLNGYLYNVELNKISHTTIIREYGLKRLEKSVAKHILNGYKSIGDYKYHFNGKLIVYTQKMERKQ